MSEVKTTTIRRFWDHSSKPSVFVETTDGVETYRGPFAGAKADTHAERQKEIEELRRERDEARADLEFRRGLYKVLEEANNEVHNRLADALHEVDLRTLDYERIKQERDEARELAGAYKEYAQLLGDEIDDMVILAHVHGWRSSRVEQGKVLREKIKQLEGKK
jgi:hypothetical protein